MTVMTNVPVAVSMRGVGKTYGRGHGAVRALREVSLDFRPGSFTAVMGPSGSGKSTLMHCAVGLDRPSSGTVHIGETNLGELNERALTKLRRERIGFVFQAFNLLPSLTVQQNVTLPLRLAGAEIDRAWASEVLAWVGLADKARRRPAELSGGQQQRIAIARALVTRPAVIAADEPTGALDSRTGAEVLGLLRAAVDHSGQTVVMVTHDPVAASYADRTVFLQDGRITGDVPAGSAAQIAAHLTELAGAR